MSNMGIMELLVVAACCFGVLLVIAAIVVIVILLSKKKKAQATPAPDTAFEPAAFSPQEDVLVKVGEDEMGAPIVPEPEPPDLDERGKEIQSEPPDEPDEV